MQVYHFAHNSKNTNFVEVLFCKLRLVGLNVGPRRHGTVADIKVKPSKDEREINNILFWELL